MTVSYHENKTFSNDDFSGKKLIEKEFDKCTFKNCNFSNSDLSKITFIECIFDNCNLSLIKLVGSGLKNIAFTNCKIIGVDFSTCNDFLFEVKFEKCILDYTYFYKKKIRNTVFKDCIIKEANFTESDLTGSFFLNCDLSRSIFSHTNLNSVDFRTSHNYTIDPESNNIKKAKFSIHGIMGLLNKYDIVIE